MPDFDLIIEKIDNIKRCLSRIAEKTQLRRETLDNYDIQDIFILNLQRAVQAAIDIAVHYVSSKGWGVPSTIKENFSILAQNRVINSELAERLEKMVGFRNIAVHDYSAMDIDILKYILEFRLKGLEEFYSVIYKLIIKG